jgi:tripartite-type tricarboxylate transporter receptor subunit TctC
VVHIPYPRSPEAMVDLMAGRLSFVFDPSLTAIGQVQGGAVRPMGVSAPVRLAALADVPTMEEAGLPGFVSQTWNTISAPAGTPDEIVMALNGMINEIVQADAMRARLEELASIVPPPRPRPRSMPIMPRSARPGSPWCAAPACAARARH